MIVALRSPGEALTALGAPGTVRGVTGADGADAVPGPAALEAVTVKAYAVPLVSPVTGKVPVTVGGVHETIADSLPGIAVTALGGPGGEGTKGGGGFVMTTGVCHDLAHRAPHASRR